MRFSGGGRVIQIIKIKMLRENFKFVIFAVCACGIQATFLNHIFPQILYLTTPYPLHNLPKTAFQYRAMELT